MDVPQFVHLHSHSEFSLLDGAARLTVYHAQSTRDRWAELFAEGE